MSKLKVILPVAISLLLISSSVALAVVILPATPGTCTDAEKLTIPGCQPPINVSGTAQTKTGGLGLGSLIVTNSALISGKLGLGLSSPGPKLYVQDAGADFFNLALLKNTNLAGSSVISFNSGGADAFWGLNGPSRAVNPNQVFMGNGNANGGFLFFTGGGEVANERMRITSTGNVGIGTTNPTVKLQVNGSVAIVDGTQGAGKVLTSDANGKASWGTGGGALPVCDAGQILVSAGGGQWKCNNQQKVTRIQFVAEDSHLYMQDGKPCLTPELGQITYFKDKIGDTTLYACINNNGVYQWFNISVRDASTILSSVVTSPTTMWSGCSTSVPSGRGTCVNAGFSDTCQITQSKWICVK